VLKPSGRLVLLTPNLHSLGHRFLRECWLQLDVPRHLHLYSRRSLEALVADSGLNIETLRTTIRKADWNYWLSVMIRKTGRAEWPSRAYLGSRVIGLGYQHIEEALCLFGYDVGEDLLLVARKWTARGPGCDHEGA
jgi:hypothetical protein